MRNITCSGCSCRFGLHSHKKLGMYYCPCCARVVEVSFSGLKFHVHAGGRTVGDGDHVAEVAIPYAPTDVGYVALVREQLTEAFKSIFDVTRVRVLTDEEQAKEDEDDD